MLKHLLNTCRISLELQPTGPLLIKSGASLAAGVDMAFVRSNNQVYLPGSSLKGVIRSHCEKIGRTLAEERICNPFNTKSRGDRNPSPMGVHACSDYLAGVEKKRNQGGGKAVMPSHEAYKLSCPACRLFGSLMFGGRFNIGDAYLKPGTPEPQIEYRDGVGIDRFSGGTVNGAKYQFEVITSGTFATQLTVQNFELWQLSWLSFTLRDMQDELVSFGMGGSRGLGRMRAKVLKVELDQLTTEQPQEVEGIGMLYDQGEAYGLALEAGMMLPDGVGYQERGIRWRATITGAQPLAKFYEEVALYFPAYAEEIAKKPWRTEPAFVGGGR